MIRIGVIGFGYWGPNVARNLAETPGASVVAVADRRPERRALAAVRHPGARTVADAADLICDPAIDAIAIATPVASHYALARAAIEAGKHILVEKPLATSSDEALSLIDLAAKHSVALMVDHTFIYTGAVRTIRQLVTDGEVGDLYYYDSVRVNLGLFQHDVDVLWDLAVHDLSIMDYVLPMAPREVSAVGLGHVSPDSADIAYLTLFFDARVIAHIHVNWLAPVKVRRTLIGASRRMIVYDDLDPSEPVKVYDRGIEVSEQKDGIYQMLVGYRTGDMWAPRVDQTEALRSEAAHFVSCINDGASPITDGEAGLRVVRVLEAASRSLAMQGRVMPIVSDGRP